MKRILALVLAAMMLLSMAACAASTPAAAEAAADTNTEAVTGVEDGVLTVGMECAYAPYNWTQMDDSNGAVPISNVPGAYANGYDVMIAQKICEANGWQLEIVSSAWDSLCPAVQSGTMDANIAGQSMTAHLYRGRKRTFAIGQVQICRDIPPPSTLEYDFFHCKPLLFNLAGYFGIEGIWFRHAAENIQISLSHIVAVSLHIVF